MRIQQIWFIASLSLVAIAFAIPASAGAEPGAVFTHEGIPIEGSEVVTAKFEGTMEYELHDRTGIHCPSITVEAKLEANGTGTVSQFITPGTACKVFGPTPAKGFVVHATPVGMHGIAPTTETNGWHLTAEPANDWIAITGVHITNKITHPSTTHLVVAESTLHGTITALVNTETTDATTLILKTSPDEVTLNMATVMVRGHLKEETDTHVGIE